MLHVLHAVSLSLYPETLYVGCRLPPWTRQRAFRARTHSCALWRSQGSPRRSSWSRASGAFAQTCHVHS